MHEQPQEQSEEERLSEAAKRAEERWEEILEMMETRPTEELYRSFDLTIARLESLSAELTDAQEANRLHPDELEPQIALMDIGEQIKVQADTFIQVTAVPHKITRNQFAEYAGILRLIGI